VSYFVEAPGIGYNCSEEIFTANSEIIKDLPDSVIVNPSQNDGQNKGIYASFNSDRITMIGQNANNENSDTFLALPLTHVPTNLEEKFEYYGMSVSENPLAFRSMILIVGTEDNTEMNITAKFTVDINVCNGTDTVAEYHCVINKLQTVLIYSINDLTGTKIVTNNEVSVFSGHQAGSVIKEEIAYDHLIEQIPSIEFWGKEHYTVPLGRKYNIKILAAYNLTNVTIYCTNNDGMNSMDGINSMDVINEGDSINKIFSHQEYCAIYSNNSVLVVQFSFDHAQNDGGPMMTLVPATIHYLNRLDFSTIRRSSDNYKNCINIIVMAQYYQPDMMNLIVGGKNISLQSQNISWDPINVDNVVKAYATQVCNIPEGIVRVTHANTSALMTAIAYGFSDSAGYGHPGGLYLKPSG